MCIKPIRLPDVGEVPCGKCALCRKRYVNDWYYRLSSEYKASSATYFCTLTFSEEYVPTTREEAVNKHQLFMKRLRKKFGKFRFFSVLEYGPSTGRPHFHILLFSDGSFNKDNLLTVWQYGFVTLEPLRSEAGIRYTCKYMNKDDYQSVMLCSKRPFLGYNALDRNLDNFIQNAKTSFGGGLPRIYKKKLQGIEEFEEAKEKNRLDFLEKKLQNYKSDTPRYIAEERQKALNLLAKKRLC